MWVLLLQWRGSWDYSPSTDPADGYLDDPVAPLAPPARERGLFLKDGHQAHS